jgi:UDP-glucose 4-epimerase
MRVLVTGGAGFIGSNLVRTLLTGDYQVGVLDDFSTGHVDNLHPAAWFRTLDITGPDLTSAVAEFAPDAVVHLAAQTSVPVSVVDPERDHLVNVEGTRAVARAARAAGARLVLSASSAAVYGDPEVLPLPETAAKRPANPYGRSKLEAEAVLAEELRGSDTDFACLRFANVFGPRQDALGEGGVVAIFASKMQAKETPVIYGSGAQTRDFIYVGDIVSAIISALHAPEPLALEGVDGPAYNISTGKEMSVDELASALRLATRYMGGIDKQPAREGDIERSVLDPSKVQAALDWSAHAPFENALGRTVGWFAR